MIFFFFFQKSAALPSQKINEKYFSHLKNVKLADPHFHILDKIDIILGSDYFFFYFNPQITCSQSDLIAQNSIFGFSYPENYQNLKRYQIHFQTCIFMKY